jgi:hypothetical protein
MKQSQFTKIIDVVLITLAFIIVLIAMLLMKYTIIIKYRIETNIFQNIDKGPIQDIAVGRSKCEDDFEPFYYDYFPGVEEGSYHITDEQNKDGHYSHEPCEDEEEDPNCKSIPEIPKYDLKLWRDKVLCLKRYDPAGYNTTYVIAASDAECPPKTRLCGYYNKFLDKLCFDEEIRCPVNYISIERKRIQDDSYVSIDLESNYTLVYSFDRIFDIVPIDFNITQYIPCVESDRKSFDPNVGYFPFINELETFGCNQTEENYFDHFDDDGYDYRYKYLDSMKKFNYYTQNDLKKKYELLPDIGKEYTFEKELKSFVYLVSRGYNSINMKCVSPYDYQRFIYNLFRIKSFYFEHLSICLTNLILICVFVSILSLFKFVKKKQYVHLGLQFLKIAWSIVFIVFNFSYAHMGIGKIDKLAGFLADINSTDCVDYEMMSAFYRYSLKWVWTKVTNYSYLYYVFAGIYTAGVALQLSRLVYKTIRRIRANRRTKNAKDQLLLT